MVDQLLPGAQEEIQRGADRGLWFAVFDPSGHSGRRARASHPSPTPVRRGGGRLAVAIIGEPDQWHPTTAASGSVEVVFAGRLFERPVIATGRRPSSEASDASLVLRAYEDQGPEALGRLRGAFAAIISDAERELLLAARDQLGLSPLFSVDLGPSLVLSSTVDGLFQSPSVPRTLNRLLLVDHLRHRQLDPGETHFEAIRRVPPGHALRREGGRTTVTRFWDPAPRGEVDWLTEDEAEGFGQVLDRAVARCLQLGHAGIYLSGGLDSVSVAALASDVSRRLGMPTPVALSLGFPHPEANEEEVQRRVAQQLGLPHVLLPLEEAVGPAGLLQAGLDLSRAWPAPLLNFWLPGYCRLAVEGRERGCRVILTGGGGDEWLSVGPYYAADSLRHLDLRGLRLVWNVWRRSYPLSTRQMLRSLWIFGAKPPLEHATRRALGATAPSAIRAWRRRSLQRAWPVWLAPDPDLRGLVSRREVARPSEMQPGKGRFAYYLWDGRKSLDHAVVSLEMEEDFEVARRLGLLEVHPYWDPDVVDFLFRTPPDLLLRGGRGKGLVRHMLASRFPGLGFESQKKVVSTGYFRSVLLRQAIAAWQTSGGIRALDELGVVDGRRFDREVQSIVEREEQTAAYRIWDVLSLESWARGRL